MLSMLSMLSALCRTLDVDEGGEEPAPPGPGNCKAVLRGSFFLAWGRLSARWVSFLLCSVGCCPSVAWPYSMATLSL